MGRQYTIFINHPSHGLTDHEPWGDGLIAWSFIEQLARRGHQLYIAAPIAKLHAALPSNVHLTIIRTKATYAVEYPSWPHRIEYALRVRHFFNKLSSRIHFDLIHQLNPVTTGVNLFLPRVVPFIAGPVWPQWPSAASTFRFGLTPIYRKLLRWELYRRVDCILAAVPASRAFLPDSPAIQAKVRLLPCGIDTQRFAPSGALPAEDPAPPHILFLAALHRNKGIYVLLDAFEHVARTVPGVQLIIAGDGPEREAVQRRIAVSPAAARFTMVGSLARDKVIDAFNACAVYCLPSFGEPFGLSALEAMSCARPLVVTAAGGLDYLVDEPGGAKVPVGQPAPLAEALIRLLRDPKLRARMGEHNRSRAVSVFDWVRVVTSLENIYEETIRNSRRGSH